MTRSPRSSLALSPAPLLMNAVALLAIAAVAVAVVQSALITQHPTWLGAAVTIDLTLTATLLHLWLGVRRGGLPGWTLVPVFASGVLGSRWLLPAGAAPPDSFGLVLLAAVEVAVIGLALFRISVVVRGFRRVRDAGGGRFDALEAGFVDVVPLAPGLARWIRLEAELWTLAVAGWFLKPPSEKDGAYFSHHRQAQWLPLVGVMAFLSLIEASLVHLWLQRAGHEVSMVAALVLHAYGFVWLLGDAQALRIRRTQLLEREGGWTLRVRVGLRAEAMVLVDDIESVDCGRWERATGDEGEGLVRVLGPANLRLVFSRPVELKTLLGGKMVNSLVVQVDDAEQLRDGILAAQSTGVPMASTISSGVSA